MPVAPVKDADGYHKECTDGKAQSHRRHALPGRAECSGILHMRPPRSPGPQTDQGRGGTGSVVITADNHLRHKKS